MYFWLLKIIYNMSKLHINDDKTNLMMSNNPRIENDAKEIKTTTDKFTIVPEEKFKILGWLMN